MHLRPIILTKTVKCYVQLRTAAKHIVYASLVARHFLEIEGCELTDFYQTLEIKPQHPVPGIQSPKLS